MDKIEQIFLLYGDKMYSKAFSILKNREAAEDAVQEAFVKIIKHKDIIDDVKSAGTKALILTIVENSALDRYRYEQRELKRAEKFEIEAGIMYEDFSADEILAETVIGGDTEELVLELKAEDREIIFMKYGMDLSDEKMAAALGVNYATLRKRLQRARDRLAKLIEERGSRNDGKR